MSEDLGKAVLTLGVDGLTKFGSNMKEVKRGADEASDHLDKLAGTSKVTADEVSKVKITDRQVAESAAAAKGLNRELSSIERNANEARRSLDRLRLSGIDLGGGGGGRAGVPGNGSSGGRGFGPFGPGFGKVGVLGAAIGAGVFATPALGPAALGIAGISGVGLAGLGGTVGTLALAFAGVGKAIGGDLQAFKSLQPAQQQFVLLTRSLSGWLDKLKETAAGSLFPNLTKGLKAALSPGTLGAITQAVTEFGHALGDAGEAWGKYFGSTQFQQIFGPVMKAAAGTVRGLAGAALSLFDAFGVLTRAAIPLTGWLTTQAAKGAKWLDVWLRAKDATGGLAHAMDNAKGSLAQAGKLLSAIVKAVLALGTALYPVSNKLLTAMTKGFNGLADVIDRNKTSIGNFVSTMVDGASTLVSGIAKALTYISKGWDAVFGKGGSMVVAIGVVGAALAATLGPEALIIAGVILAAGEVKDHWSEIQVWFEAFTKWLPNSFAGMWSAVKGVTQLGVYAILQPVEALAIAFAKLTGWLSSIPGLGGISKGASSAASAIGALANHFKSSGTGDLKDAWASFTPYLKAAQSAADIAALPGKVAAAAAAAVAAAEAKAEAAKEKAAEHVPSVYVSPFGPAPAWTKNLGTKTTKKKVIPLSASLGAGGTVDKAAALLSAMFSGPSTGLDHLNIFDLLASSAIPNKPSPTGINLIPTALRLAIDKARITPGTKDDLAAYKKARAALESMAKSATGLSKLHLADEIATLSTKINSLSKAVTKTTGSFEQANEAQFLSSFENIQRAYAPNAFPDGGLAKTNTHLYNLTSHAREQTSLLKKVAGATKFPSSHAAQVAVESAFG